MTLSPDFPPPLPEVADQDMELLDIHTHRTPPPADALLSVTLPLPPDATLDRLSDGSPVALGLHPWKTAGFNTPEEASTLLAELADLAATPQVIAIGEAGLDPLRGAPLPVQESVFRSQIAISETTGKPLIIHLVRAWDQFLKIRRDTAPPGSFTASAASPGFWKCSFGNATTPPPLALHRMARCIFLSAPVSTPAHFPSSLRTVC